MLNEKILPIISPSNTSSTSTSSNVSPSSSPLVRRTSSKRSLSASDSLSQKCIQDVDITDTIRLDNAMKTVISAFAVFNISFKSAESPLFRKFITDINLVLHNQKLYRSILKKNTIEYADQLRKRLLLFLQQEHHYVTLAVDGWTNTCGDKVRNVMLICKNKAYYWYK